MLRRSFLKLAGLILAPLGGLRAVEEASSFQVLPSGPVELWYGGHRLTLSNNVLELLDSRGFIASGVIRCGQPVYRRNSNEVIGHVIKPVVEHLADLVKVQEKLI